MKVRAKLSDQIMKHSNQSMTSIDISLDKINKQRRKYPFHVTVNDYILCLISHSIGKVIANSKEREKLSKMLEQVIIPVNLRKQLNSTQYHDFGNVVGVFVYLLPLNNDSSK